MAIGTLAALAIGAATVGSAAISSSAASKASKAATQAADTSAAVQREQLQVAQNALAPYNQAGIAPSNAINALLGLSPTQQPAQQPMQQTTQQTMTQQVPWGGNYADWQYSDMPTAQPVQPVNSGQNYQNAFDNYKNSTGYQFRFDQGMNALNSGWAGNGMLKSGAAAKAAINYGQGMGSQEFNNYLAALGNQQALGLSAGSALAGVGQNYANSLTAINANKADAIGNAALANAGNINTTINGLTSGIFKYGMK